VATTTQLPIPYLTHQPEAFLKLWPHRFDWLYAEHPDPGTTPKWQTERRFPLDDRAILQGERLYGVRFGKTTAYVMIDVDRRSVYHPEQDEFGIGRIRQAMESIGLTDCVVCTSSYSGGLHLYFPFAGERRSWEMGVAVTTLLERQGLKVKPGLLEVFPNARGYSRELSLLNGHRLPMQAGSYVLNADLAKTWSDRDSFAAQWSQVQKRNQVDPAAIKRLLKTRSRKFGVTTSAEKFLNDLNAVIEAGWTDHGQTNFILGRVAMRSYIFGHVLYADRPLEGEDLVRDIMTVAKRLPGFQEWCGHQSDLEERSREWASCIERSDYFHYGQKELKSLDQSGVTLNGREVWNESQRLQARERIKNAIADLLEKEILASGATDRFNQLITYGVGGSTLYKHRDLWDPRILQIEISPEENPVEVQNLLGENGSNNTSSLGSGDLAGEPVLSDGRNVPSRLVDWVEPMTADRAVAIEKDEVVAIDLSDLIVAIQVLQVRLGWSREDLAIFVLENFGGRRRCQLGTGELLDLCDRLEGLVEVTGGVTGGFEY
jgi:hypothetical protein